MGEQDRCGWPVLDCTLSGENNRLLAALDAMTAERDAALERIKAMEAALSTLEALPSIAAIRAMKEPKE